MDAVMATRYVTPLREGGSLPGLMEADDLGMYVVKFRGAGQGPAALVAEVICAGLASAAGLDVPRWVPVELPAQLAPAEPDEEVQHLLRASAGLNLGIDFLPGALDVGPMPAASPGFAGRVVWLDALVGNRDRSWRNPNMLTWHGQLYLIDHGATLTFHHSWAPDRPDQVERYARQPYPVADHALLECRPDIAAADAVLGAIPWPEVIRAAVAEVPEQWLDTGFGEPDAVRAAYVAFLLARVAARDVWVPALTADVAAGPARDARGHRVAARPGSGAPAWVRERGIGREAGS